MGNQNNKAAQPRILGKPIQDIAKAGTWIVAVPMVLYHLLSTQHIFLPWDLHKNVHLTFALLMVYLSLIRLRPTRWILTFILMVFSVFATMYVSIFYDDLIMRIGLPTMTDMFVAVILVIVVLEATRQSFGITLPVFTIFFMAYAFLGSYIPGPLRVPYFNAEHILTKIALDFNGIFGVILGISASYIFLFVVFGSLMKATGTVKFFEQVGTLVGKRFRSGTALSAISTSALFGMFTGAASSNVVLTGSFTIPAMKKSGYTAEQAGAIEASASTVGQVMPPIMGAAAFVMADFTDVPYLEVIRIALIPAVLTYLCMAVYVQLRAMKTGIKRHEGKVDYKVILRYSHLFFLPLLTLIFLLVKGYSPNFAIFWTIIVLVMLCQLRKDTRLSLKDWINVTVEGAVIGSRIAVMCAAIGIVVATIVMTGLGVKIPTLIQSISGGILILILMLTMVASMILGLGVPTTAAYILVAFTIAPILINKGIPVMAAHFFVFYFAVFSLVTPPVAPAVVTASALSNSNFLLTGIEASKVAIAGFLLPFLIIFCPILLLQPEALFKGVMDLIIIVLSVVGLQVVLVGYYITICRIWDRLLMGVSVGFLLAYCYTESIFFLVGLGGFIGVTLVQLYNRSRLMNRELLGPVIR